VSLHGDRPAASGARSLARRLLPFGVRLELLRLRRLPGWLVETPTIARVRLPASKCSEFRHLLARHASPLARATSTAPPALQRGKERNVALAVRLLDRLLVPPHRIFSYHRTIGRPTRLRGFRPGLELHEERPEAGIGGGLCQVSNTLYLLALRAGMTILERHRHALDLFPDHQRTVPFGCGATVFYNYADLRWENVLPQPVLLRLQIREGELIGEVWTPEDPGWRAEIYEVEHRFFRDGDAWMRENRIRRRFTRPDGTLLLDHEIAHNRGRVLYEPPGEA
jgi:vancomycin resistance protein VanW